VAVHVALGQPAAVLIEDGHGLVLPQLLALHPAVVVARCGGRRCEG
jgi:hypothetical protein